MAAGWMFLWSVLFILCLYVQFLSYPSPASEEIYWDWRNLENLTDYSAIPPDFTWGVATAAHQIEGNCNNNNWYEWEHGVKPDGQSNIKRGQKSGLACNSYELYKEDVKLMEELGIQSYRFSLEWSKIQPEKDRFDEAVIKHYHDQIDLLLAKKIEPMVTLFHFTIPSWFVKLGGFEKEENIVHFVEFSKKMIQEYGKKVNWWCTLNEPEVYSFVGYFVGAFPPGKNDLALVVEVMKNLFESHVRIYESVKSTEEGKNFRIGFAKNVVIYDPYNRFNPVEAALSQFTDFLWNQLFLKFFSEGVYRVFIPGYLDVTHIRPNAPNTLDYVGINYYTHAVFRSQLQAPFFNITSRPNEIPTDFFYGIYAEGLYRGLQSAGQLKKPIYITETGVADRFDDIRQIWIQRHVYAIAKAIKEGIDVRGLFYWTLMDNFEWAEGFDMRFGLYETNFTTQERKLRRGSKAFIDIVKQTRSHSNK